jgi:hypothetical protein
MPHTAKYLLDRSYWSECFDQAVRYGSRWKKIELAIGGAFIIAGFSLWLYFNRALFLPWVLVALGVIEIFSSRIKKFFWLRKQLGSKHSGFEVTHTFDDRGIQTAGKYSNGLMSWAGIEKLIETPEGLLIWPQKSIYWYLPKRSRSEEAIAFIKKKAFNDSLQPNPR